MVIDDYNDQATSKLQMLAVHCEWPGAAELAPEPSVNTLGPALRWLVVVRDSHTLVSDLAEDVNWFRAYSRDASAPLDAFQSIIYYLYSAD
jgi:hypothetical protein